MKEVRVWDNDKLLSQEELAEVIETVESLDFDWCKECIIVHVYISAHVKSEGESETFNPRFDALAEADDDSGYFGWPIL